MSFSNASDYEPQTQDKVLGTFIVLALLVLFYLLIHRAFIENFIGDWFYLEAEMPKTYGVTKGTLIELSGVTIGVVDSVSLQPSTRVLIRMRFDQNQTYLLRRGSQFRINSDLGIDTVLSGVRLELVPGDQKDLIAENKTVSIIEPKSINQLMDEFKVEELAEQAKNIVANLEIITGTVSDKQDKLNATLNHLEMMSSHLSQTSSKLPSLIEELKQTNQLLQSDLKNVDYTLSEIREPVVTLLTTTNKTLQGVEKTLLALNPVFDNVPALVQSADKTLQSVNYLSYKLSNHWLLSEGARVDDEDVITIRMMPDEELYQGE